MMMQMVMDAIKLKISTFIHFENKTMGQFGQRGHDDIDGNLDAIKLKYLLL